MTAFLGEGVQDIGNKFNDLLGRLDSTKLGESEKTLISQIKIVDVSKT
jgi:hypothetical protein